MSTKYYKSPEGGTLVITPAPFLREEGTLVCRFNIACDAPQLNAQVIPWGMALPILKAMGFTHRVAEKALNSTITEWHNLVIEQEMMNDAGTEERVPYLTWGPV